MGICLSGTIHSVMCLGVFIQASVGGPLLPVCDKDGERRLPVVIFSHGLWACRTTYTAFCCDLASHGYSKYFTLPCFGLRSAGDLNGNSTLLFELNEGSTLYGQRSIMQISVVARTFGTVL